METLLANPVWSICYLAVLVGLSAFGLHRYWILIQYLRHRNRPHVAPDRFAVLPFVTIQLPVFNEVYVVRRLLEAVSKIDYPRDRLQIQILDDSTDETAAITADEALRLRGMGFDVDRRHRTDRQGFKAGALREGLRSAKGEFLFILDADFVPAPDVLLRSIHHFTDPKTGMVQMRWGHLNQSGSLLTRVQSILLDGHLVLEQSARSRSGKFFNFNGTAGIWRRQAIVDGGGWQDDTLTEDLDLSYRSQLAGWEFVYLPEIVIPAELPSDMNGFKNQQHRWAKGSIQTFKKLMPRIWASEISLGRKVEATMHLSANFAYLLLAGLCVLVVPKSFSGSSVEHALWVDLPIFVATTVAISAYYVAAQAVLNPGRWMRTVCLLPALFCITIGISINNASAVLGALANRKSPFLRTPKYGGGFCPLSTRRKAYLPKGSFLPLIELAFAGYFAFCLWQAALLEKWITLPFLMLFCAGFAYVANQSIGFWIRRANRRPRPMAAPGSDPAPVPGT